ncbi:MAG: hypothetical protein J0I45_13465 [Bosea sp.]|nr:hypothetical protein [Bosea sp. (in: a-proteobacteria)]
MTMNKKTSSLFAAAALLAALASAPALAQDTPSLSGAWKGKSDAIGKQPGFTTGDVTITVTEQQGRSFRAKVSYPSEKGEISEDLIGTVTPDGKGIFLVGDDGIHLGTLSGETLDVCYLETGDDAMAACSRLTKQP